MTTPSPEPTGHVPELVIVVDGYVTHADGTIDGPALTGPDAILPALDGLGVVPGQVVMGPAGLLAVRAALAVPAARRRLTGRAFNAVGLATTHANNLLNVYRGTNFTGITLYAQLHTGDPGSAGTSNVSGNTNRYALTFNVASAGSLSLASAPTSWAMTGTEALSHISFWDASSSGNFVRSAALTATRNVQNGDTFTLSVCTFSYTPLAA